MLKKIHINDEEQWFGNIFAKCLCGWGIVLNSYSDTFHCLVLYISIFCHLLIITVYDDAMKRKEKIACIMLVVAIAIISIVSFLTK